MTVPMRAIRCLLVAASFGALCEFTSVVGALITLGAGLLALMGTPRDIPMAESASSEYGAWLICVLGFALTTLALVPLGGGLGGPVAVALCICAPLLGTMVY